MRINNVISVCCKKDILIWRISSEAILRNIESDDYICVVPDAEVDIFKKNTSSKWKIISENNFIKINKSYVHENLPCISKNKSGWYYQQLIKIQAMLLGNENSINLIWDADTIPLEKIIFFKENKLILNMSDEFHQPYFFTIKDILNIEKNTEMSFISQNFISKRKWIIDLIINLEKINNKKWYDAILKNDRATHQLFFSEYETMGTFIMNNFKSDVILMETNWCRDGAKIINSPFKLNYEHIKNTFHDYKYVAFESWHFNKFMFKLMMVLNGIH